MRLAPAGDDRSAMTWARWPGKTGDPPREDEAKVETEEARLLTGAGAAAIRAAAALPFGCDCGGAGYYFGGGYGLIACADCNDDGDKPKPQAISALRMLPKRPEPWRESPSGWRYRCDQCKEDAHLTQWTVNGLWWVCGCLAVAETTDGEVAVLIFPRPTKLPSRLPTRLP